MARRQDRQSIVDAIRDLLLGNFHLKFEPIEESDVETVMNVQEPSSRLRYEVRVRAVE